VDLFGSFTLLLAFLCSLYAIGGGIAGIWTRHPLLIKSARNAGFAICALVWLSISSLAYLFVTDNFAIAYVADHSNRTLPLFFKIAAIWSGQEGSLLFWSFILSLYVFSVLFTYRGKHPELMPYVNVVLAGVQAFFLGSLDVYDRINVGGGTFPDVTITLRAVDAQTGAIVWSATRSGGGVGIVGRLFGFGGDTMSEATQKTVRAALATLFR